MSPTPDDRDAVEAAGRHHVDSQVLALELDERLDAAHQLAEKSSGVSDCGPSQLGVLGVGMHLDHEAVGTGRDRGARHRRDQVAAAGRVRRVDDDRQVREHLERGDRREIERVARVRLEGADAALARA